MPALKDSEPLELSKAASVQPELVLRTGGRLVAAIRDQSYYVEYAPQRGLRWPRLSRAASGKQFGFEVLMFASRPRAVPPGGFAVERAGEIVAVAVARQLDAMGFRVGIDLGPTLKPLRDELGDRFRIDLDGLALKATVSGGVHFVVQHRTLAQHTTPNDAFETRADLDVTLFLIDRAGRPLYARRVTESASLVARALEGAAERARAVAAQALQRFLGTAFRDARLEEALLEYTR
jgi:hypothetical protein